MSIDWKTMDSLPKETAIFRLANLAWVAYYDYYTRRNSRLFHERKASLMENKFNKAFMAIGKFCLDKHYDPADYIERAATFIPVGTIWVTPKEYTKKSVAANYYSLYAKQDSKPGEDWATYMNYLAHASSQMIPSPHPSLACLLMDYMQPLPAWFRVLGPEKPVPEIVEVYGEEAMRELRKDTRLVEFLRRVRKDNLEKFEETHGRLWGG